MFPIDHKVTEGEMFNINFVKCFKSIMVSILTVGLFLPPYCDAQMGETVEPLFQKGMCYVTWDKDKFESNYSDMALKTLKEMGVEYLQIAVTQYQEKIDSTDIYPTEFTPSDRSVKHVIKDAHDIGLKVMLKPHIDVQETDGTCWRADIGFYNEDGWNKWFNEYTKVITHYAKIAEKYNVEIFCVGTELSFTNQKTDKWKKIISDVRKIYTGKLIYAANWDDYKNIDFWNELDFVGIDAYFPLSYKQNPSTDDIKEGWKKWKYEIEEWHNSVNKPIVFTEIGYSSSAHAPSEPWKNGSGTADVEIQSKCYNAFFETMFNSSWLAGVYWWSWEPTIYGGGNNNRQFTPFKKPAQNIIACRYNVDGMKESNKSMEKTATEKLASSLEKEILKEKNLNVDSYVTKTSTGLSVSTLSPSLKTKDNSSFQGEWKEEGNKIAYGKDN